LHRTVDVDRLLEHVALPAKYRDRTRGGPPSTSSSASCSRALALEPQALLLDEPTSALDERAREQIEAALAHFRGELGVSLVLVTHDRAQAERLAEHFVELDAGRIKVAA
jgi:ABC-type proline/glycine betaine transport system ATPase subunit